MFEDPKDLGKFMFLSAAEVSKQKTQPVLAKTGEFLMFTMVNILGLVGGLLPWEDNTPQHHSFKAQKV